MYAIDGILNGFFSFFWTSREGDGREQQKSPLRKNFKAREARVELLRYKGEDKKAHPSLIGFSRLAPPRASFAQRLHVLAFSCCVVGLERAHARAWKLSLFERLAQAQHP